jgi:hypothetical protein
MGDRAGQFERATGRLWGMAMPFPADRIGADHGGRCALVKSFAQFY